MNLEQRIVLKEKELADLKLQFEGRPTHVKVPLTSFHFDRYPNLENIDDLTIQRIVAWLETEIVNNLSISVQN